MSSRIIYTCDSCGKDFSYEEYKKEFYDNCEIDIPTTCFTVDLCKDCVNKLESVVKDFLSASKK